jgi:siroheme synthase
MWYSILIKKLTEGDGMNMWFPLFVNLENKKVLVIGGGKIAYKKITKILEYSANVTIVTEKIEEEKLLQLENVKIVDNKRIENDKDTIEELVKDYFLVIAATNDEELNENIAKICDSRGILINNISSKTEMNAMFGGIVKNDEFQIAVSTGGKNCRRSRAMKSEIQKILDKIEK